MNQLRFALFFLIACGSPTDLPQEDDPAEQQTGSAMIDGKPAADYYAQFQWETTKREMKGAGAFATQADGKNMFLMTFYLKKSGDFVLFYEEGTGDVTLSGYGGNFDPSTAVSVKGKSSVSGTDLLLGDVVRCAYRAAINGKETLECTLKDALGSAAAKGKSARVSLGSESSPTDSSWADYTPR